MRPDVAAPALAILLAGLLPAVAGASTIRQMTFTGIPDLVGVANVWEEDGITASGTIASYFAPDAVHLDPGGSPYGKSISFTTGSLFDSLSIDILSPAGLYCPEGFGCGSIFAYDDPYPNVLVSGFVEDALVSTLGLSQSNGVFETIQLGDGFKGIDRLTVTVRHPFELGLSGDCVEYCGHFDLDTVVLRDVSPVPEPGSVVLFATAMLVASAVRGGARSSARSAR